MKNNKIKLALCGLIGVLGVCVPLLPTYADTSDFYDPSSITAPMCGYDKTKEISYQCKFFCNALGLNADDYITYEDDEFGTSVSAPIKELEAMYLESLGYTGNRSVEEDDENIIYKYRQYSFGLGQVIETESCYSKAAIEESSANGEYVFKPTYSVSYNSCKFADGMVVTLNDYSAYDQAVAAAKKCIGNTDVSKFLVDADSTVYYYMDNELACSYVYYDEPVYDDDLGVISGQMYGPDGNPLSEVESDELWYKYSGLSNDDLLKDKKELLNMIFYQYNKSSMSHEEALSKYDELLANIDYLSTNELLRIHNRAFEVVLNERLAAMEARNNQHSDNDIPDLSTGYFQDLVGNIPTLQGGTPTKIMTRVIHDCPVVTLYDANNQELVGNAVTSVEHTRFKYAYFTFFAEMDNGHVMMDLAGSDSTDVGGINTVNHSYVDTPDGPMGTTAYYEDAYAGEDSTGVLDPYATE